jgi:hypothetical protein
MAQSSVNQDQLLQFMREEKENLEKFNNDLLKKIEQKEMELVSLNPIIKSNQYYRWQ